MSQIPKISESEWEIMKVVWESNPITANKIIDELQSSYDWSTQTIKTYINRLVKKSVLGFEKVKRHYNYYPLITEKDCIIAESNSFIKRVFNGAASAMVSNFITNGDLTDEDIAKLEKILQDKKSN